MTGFTNEKIYLAFSLFVAALVSYISFQLIHTERILPDEALYAWLAQRIAENPSMILSFEATAFHPPGFAFFLALASGGNAEFSTLKIIVFITYVLAQYAIVHVAYRIKGAAFAAYCLLALSVNTYFTIYSHYLTMDTLLVALHIAFLGLLIFNKPNEPKYDFIIALASALCISLKWSAVFLLPVMCLYYFLNFKGLPVKKRIQKMVLAVLLSVIVILGFALNHHAHTSSYLPQGAHIVNNISSEKLLKWVKLIINTVHPVLVPVFILGCFRINKEKKSLSLVLCLWIVISALGILMFTDLNSRYGLQVLPATVLITGFGFVQLQEMCVRWKLSTNNSYAITILFAMLLGGVTLNSGFKAVYDLNVSSIGFRQAAKIISQIGSPGTRILCLSPRQIRYVTGINYENFGGRLLWINQGSSSEKFAQYVKGLDGNKLLVLDVWSIHKPKWAVFNSKKELKNVIKFMKDNNFKLVDVVEHELVEGGVLRRVPIILIFKSYSLTNNRS